MLQDTTAPEFGTAKTARPELTMFDVIAKRAFRLAQFLDKTKLAQEAVHKVCHLISNYALRNGLTFADLKVREVQSRGTADGTIIVIFIDRKR